MGPAARFRPTHPRPPPTPSTTAPPAPAKLDLHGRRIGATSGEIPGRGRRDLLPAPHITQPHNHLTRYRRRCDIACDPIHGPSTTLHGAPRHLGSTLSGRDRGQIRPDPARSKRFEEQESPEKRSKSLPTLSRPVTSPTCTTMRQAESPEVSRNRPSSPQVGPGFRPDQGFRRPSPGQTPSGRHEGRQGPVAPADCRPAAVYPWDVTDRFSIALYLHRGCLPLRTPAFSHNFSYQKTQGFRAMGKSSPADPGSARPPDSRLA